jgi:hypothetical protein
MRTFDEIKYIIVDAKNSSEALAELNSTSKVAIWNEWANNIAYAHYVLEQSFDKHKAEVLEALTQLKPHTARWYRNKALAFQYGFDLVMDQDYFDNTGFTDEQIENSKIIKYSAVTEAEIESRLIVKIATEIGTELQPISEAEKEAFTAYMKEICDAGVRITVINYLPDILQLTMQIYRDPLVLDANGNSILTGKRPVEDAIKEYMKELPFDGELVLAHLIDKLQKVEGVIIPHLLSAASKWIDANINDYGAFQPISVKKIPISGYFKVEDFLNISYVV